MLHWVHDLSKWKCQPFGRTETIAVTPPFRDVFRERRALAPMDAFYEWHGPNHRPEALRAPRSD